MRSLKRGSVLLLLGVLGLFAPEAVLADHQVISDSSVSVTSGDYGTNEDTTVTQLSQSFKYRMERGEAGIVAPYLFRDGTSATPGESRRAKKNRAVPEEADGLGDVRVKGRYYWLEETDGRPAVDLAGQVKFPTADEDEGLGTGGFDVGFGPEVSKRFARWIPFANLELLLRETPGDSTVKSARLDYALGTGYAFTEQWTGYVSLEGGTRSNDGADPPLELVLSGNYKTSDSVSLNGFVLAGLTDGSPDAGGGAGVTVRF